MDTRKVDIETLALSKIDLLALLGNNTEILLMNGDEPIARLSPIEKSVPTEPKPRIPDLHPGAWMSEDFNDPLPDEFWLGEA